MGSGMTKQSKIIISCAGVISAAGLFALIYYSQTSNQALERDTQLQKVYTEMLKTLKNKCKPLVKKIEQFIQENSGQQEYQQLKNQLGSDFAEHILSQSYILIEKQQIEKEAFSEFNIDYSQADYYQNVLFKDSEEIQQLLAEYDNQFTSAVNSQPKQILVPESLTSEKALNITRKIMLGSIKRLQQELKTLLANDKSINIDSPEVVDVLNNIDITDLRQKIFKEEGFTQFDYEECTQVLRYAIKQFMSDKDFSQRIQDLELIHSSSMQTLMMNPTANIDFTDIYNGDIFKQKTIKKLIQ